MIEDKIQQVRARVLALRARALRMPARLAGRLDDAFDELGTTLDDLEGADRGLGRVVDELQQSREQYAELFDAAPVPLFVTTLDGSIQLANRAAAIALNALPRFLIGRSICEFLDGESHRAFPARLERLQGDPGAAEWKATVLPPQGPPFDVVIDGAILRDRFGNARSLIWTLHRETRPDPTEPSIEADALPATTAESVAEILRTVTRRAIESSPVGIILVEDLASPEIRVNPAGRQLLGPPSGDGGLDAYRGVVASPEGEEAPLESICLQRAAAGEFVTGVDLTIRRADGSSRWARACAGPTWDPSGAVSGVVIIFDEVSSLKQDQRRRAEWMSIVAHDLRAPLSVIKGYAQMLLRDRAGAVNGGIRGPSVDKPAKEQHALELIVANVDRLTRMISDLLDVSQMESQQLRLRNRVIDLTALIRSIVDQSAQTAEPKLIRLAEAPDTPLMILADPERIEQVAENLIQNAVKYSSPASEIRIGVARDVDGLRVWVANEGPGLSPAERAQIFDRFTRSQMTSSRSSGSLGLGLYIARRLVEAHGGRIWAESIPNATTTFSFTLPVVPPA